MDDCGHLRSCPVIVRHQQFRSRFREAAKRWLSTGRWRSHSVSVSRLHAAWGVETPTFGGPSAAVTSTPRPCGRGGASACPGCKPKDWCGFPKGRLSNSPAMAGRRSMRAIWAGLIGGAVALAAANAGAAPAHRAASGSRSASAEPVFCDISGDPSALQAPRLERKRPPGSLHAGRRDQRDARPQADADQHVAHQLRGGAYVYYPRSERAAWVTGPRGRYHHGSDQHPRRSGGVRAS